MDLENLKSEWSAMNDRMEKQEILKEKMFRQILNTKLDKSLSRLMAYEVIQLIFSIMLIPVLVFFLNIKITEWIHSIMIGGIVILVISIIWIGIKTIVLSKIDFAQALKNNLLYVKKYAIYIKYETLIGYYFIVPLAVLTCVIACVKLHAPLFLWVFMLCIMTAMIFFTIYLYRFCSKNISTIKQNLEELRELKEE